MYFLLPLPINVNNNGITGSSSSRNRNINYIIQLIKSTNQMLYNEILKITNINKWHLGMFYANEIQNI